MSQRKEVLASIISRVHPCYLRDTPAVVGDLSHLERGRKEFSIHFPGSQ